MKNTNILMLRLLIFSVAFIFSTSVFAQTKEAKTKKNASSTETKVSAKEEDAKTGTLKSHGKEIQKVIKNEEGVIRGYDFGTTKLKIKETEDAEYVADGKDFIIYNVSIDEKEKAEIIYYLDEDQKVKGFGIAFLVNAAAMSENIEATLIDDFQNYFNERYGKFTVNAKNDEVWTSKDGSYTLEMGDSSEEPEIVEIEIEIFKKK